MVRNQAIQIIRQRVYKIQRTKIGSTTTAGTRTWIWKIIAARMLIWAIVFWPRDTSTRRGIAMKNLKNWGIRVGGSVGGIIDVI